MSIQSIWMDRNFKDASSRLRIFGERKSLSRSCVSASLRKISISITAIILLTQPVRAEKTLESRINQIIQNSSFTPSSTSVYAVSLSNGETIVDINGDILQNPASCSKVVTAAAALEALGPNYRFHTRFATDKFNEDNGTLNNLYIWSNGDPFLVSEIIWRMINNLTGLGVSGINGNIIIDDSFFDGAWFPKKEIEDDRAYNTKTSAFSVNFNSVGIWVSPGNGSEKVITTAVPKTDYIKIINKTSIGNKYALNITKTNGNTEGETFIVSGEIPASMKPKLFYRTVENSIAYASSIFKEVVYQNNILFTGKILNGRTPGDALEILSEESKPISDTIKDMLKFSSNFAAEQLTKHLGAVKKGAPGTTEKGIAVLKNYMNSLGIPESAYTLENGSGLSDKSKLSAKQLVTILSSVHKNFKIGPDFTAALSILGVDGTMQKWRGPSQLNGNLRAKTGSLNNVASLAGYLNKGNGEVVAFAIIANGFRRIKESPHDTELKILAAIASF